MSARRREGDQLLGGISAEGAERLLTSLANADLELKTRLRAQTQKYWADLWERAGESPEQTEERAVAILRRVRRYLRDFWVTQDPHARDWYIHRAREWYWASRIQLDPDVNRRREGLDTAATADAARSASAWLNKTITLALDKAPDRTPFEESLFHLQSIAGKARYCPNPQCQAPYFIASKKGQKFCTPECARPTLLASKRNYWNQKRRTK
jgi:hypothetical protein